jgi:hypothetical protein
VTVHDSSKAVFISNATAHRVARDCAFCSKKGLPFWVHTQQERGEITGYVVVRDGIVMTNDDVAPYL